MRLAAKLAVLAALLMVPGVVAGQEWTVQTAAFQDHRQAQAQIEELRALGFDAYGEFVMFRGRQYSRVRVGCYFSQDGADYLARDLVGFVTAEAVPQPFTAGSKTRACLRIDPGFVKPEEWAVERVGNDIVFRVEVAGVVGFLHHDGEQWRLRSDLPQETTSPRGGNRFRQVEVLGQPMVATTLEDGGTLNVCAGRLLWQDGHIVIVERNSTVIACVIEEDRTLGFE